MQRQDGANVNVAVDVDRAASLALTQATAELSDSLTQGVTGAHRTPSPSQENPSLMSRGQHSSDLSEDSRDVGDLEQSSISTSTASGVQAHANHFNEAEEVNHSSWRGGSVLAHAGMLNVGLEPIASPNCVTTSVAGLAGLPTPSSYRSSFAGIRDGEAQPVPPIRRATELRSITGSLPSSRSSSFNTTNTASWQTSEEPADSLARLLIAARRSPSSSRESSFSLPGRARRGDSRESSFREMSF